VGKHENKHTGPGYSHKNHETNSSSQSSRAETSKLTADWAGAVHKKRKIKALLLTARTFVGENKEGNTKIHSTNSTNMIGKNQVFH
jgi:hypothetical protein